MRRIVEILIAFIVGSHCCVGAEYYPSGSAEIDRYREEVKAAPTTPENYQQRMPFLSLWLNIAQQRGADTHALFDSDKAYYGIEYQLVHARAAERDQLLQGICTAVDANYRDMEGVFRKLNEEGPIFRPFKGNPEGFPAGGNVEAEWPMFQKDKHNSGFTDAPGPKLGELAWKFPVGLGWHSRPVIQGDRIYVGSPGMHTTSLCLDLKTGEEIWKSTQRHERAGVYKYPANCLDSASGQILWETQLTDWIRSKPVMTSDGLLVASVDGKLACVSLDGNVQWSKQVSNHQFYADLVASGDTVLMSDSDLWLRCLNSKGEEHWKRSILNAYENEQGDAFFQMPSRAEPTTSRNQRPPTAKSISAIQAVSCSVWMPKPGKRFGSSRWVAPFPLARLFTMERCMPASKAGSVSSTASMLLPESRIG